MTLIFSRTALIFSFGTFFSVSARANLAQRNASGLFLIRRQLRRKQVLHLRGTRHHQHQQRPLGQRLGYHARLLGVYLAPLDLIGELADRHHRGFAFRLRQLRLAQNPLTPDKSGLCRKRAQYPILELYRKHSGDCEQQQYHHAPDTDRLPASVTLLFRYIRSVGHVALPKTELTGPPGRDQLCIGSDHVFTAAQPTSSPFAVFTLAGFLDFLTSSAILPR